ncbi:amidohydrolase family protein [Chitinophaga polysaccharea]|uniref:amidohydrolase family protein n=1 Tax=Chitinophaga TaxID=79328 RepID=UPI001455042A|nr:MULTISPECIES: amidohydrolase family protein [Chitinophaga]NLR59170.1 amidohydrolase family protein [Chitinophaga polysaccharea]NLU92061.1 amidohydrolase family protein [Chitinophaga sp. Ak27]
MKTYLLLLLSLLCCASYAQTPVHSCLALTGARIYTSPGKLPLENSTVIITDGKITAIENSKTIKIPAPAEVLDCKGLVMMAGFWNSHVHFIAPEWANAANAPAAELTRHMNNMINSHGFTHVFDLAALDYPNLLALKARVMSGEVKGPAILTVGVPFVPPHGSPFYIQPLKLPEINTPAEAEAFVMQQLQAGADGIKLWSASPDGHGVVPMPLNILQAASRTAHKYHKPVFAHPTADTGLNIAIAGGVDILAHVSPDGYRNWNKNEVTLLLRHKIALIPTLKLYKWELEKKHIPWQDNPLVTTALQQLRAYTAAGGEILFGTDVGYISDYSTTEEFMLLATAGLNFDQILASLTTAPAHRFRQEAHSGRIAKGMDGDIVLLQADPHDDIRHFADVVYTIRNGKIIYNSHTDTIP